MFSFNSPAVLADILMQVQLGSWKGLKTAGLLYTELKFYNSLLISARDMSILNQHLDSYSPPPMLFF